MWRLTRPTVSGYSWSVLSFVVFLWGWTHNKRTPESSYKDPWTISLRVLNECLPWTSIIILYTRRTQKKIAKVLEMFSEVWKRQKNLFQYENDDEALTDTRKLKSSFSRFYRHSVGYKSEQLCNWISIFARFTLWWIAYISTFKQKMVRLLVGKKTQVYSKLTIWDN